MKKMFLAALSCAAVFLLGSCGSSSLAVLDQGHYGEGVRQEGVSKVTVGPDLEVTGIDKTSSIFSLGISGWEKKARKEQTQEFTINPGVHTLSVKFNSDRQFVTFSNVMIANFAADKSYTITYKIDGKKVLYDIIDDETSQSVVLDVDTMKGKSTNFMSQFVKAVLNPTMEGSDKTVIEENDDYILTSLPGMKYELKNKKTNTVEKGFRGFVTDFSFKKGTVYLYETDTITTKDEFLKTDYQTNSKTVLEVVDCDTKTATYKYEKPENLAGKTITFTIRQQD